MKRKVILVEGTWGGDWAKPGSAFRQFLRAHGIETRRFEGWTESIDGVPNVLESGKHADWIAGGKAFGYYMRDVPYEDANIIVHSHGLQPVLYYAAATKRPIRRLISICSPVRSDMRVVALQAVPKIGRWRHVHSNGGDLMQLAGELFDGHLGWTRDWHLPGVSNVDNLTIPGIGHSKLLNDPTFYDLWETDGLLDFLRAAGAAAPEEVA
jgi:hypothetical protein